jgi:hypothetical protein
MENPPKRKFPILKTFKPLLFIAKRNKGKDHTSIGK